MTPFGRPLRNCAMTNASHTNVDVIRSFIDQPTTAREYKSIMTARYNHTEVVPDFRT